MKKLLTVVLLGFVVVYFSPTAGARAIPLHAHHKHHQDHKHHRHHHPRHK
jgi:hypothetical protein